MRLIWLIGGTISATACVLDFSLGNFGLAIFNACVALLNFSLALD